MSAPKVSVIIPAYGRPDLLNQAVDSVHRQTFTDHELIVVDDGSGEDVIFQYELPAGSRLVRSQRYGEPAGPRNAGIHESRGSYIAFLDQDDIWLPEKLEKQVSLLDAIPDAGLVYCHFTRVDENLDPLPQQCVPRAVGPDPIRQLIGLCIAMSPSTWLVRREVLDDVGDFDLDLAGRAEDWDLLLRIAIRYRLRDDPAPMVQYRVHEEQVTRNKLLLARGHIALLDKHTPVLAKTRPDLLPVLRRHLSHRLRQHADARLHGEGDVRGALGDLSRALRLTPWSWEIHRRLGATVLASFRTRGKKAGASRL